MRQVIKNIIFFLAVIFVLPLLALFHCLALFGNKNSLISSFSQGLSLIPGKAGNYLRSAFYKYTLNYSSPEIVVSFLTILSQQDTDLESGVYIGPQCNIGSCKIMKNTLLGSGVHIMSGKQQHNFDVLEKPIKDQGGIFTKISIGENSWVGNGSLVMANVGHNCIIGAGSVVTDDIPDNSIAAGNPAKVIKSRLKVC